MKLILGFTKNRQCYSQRPVEYAGIHLAGRASKHALCHIESMSTYVVVQDGAMFAVRHGDASGPVIATFSNKLAAETFAEKQRAKDQDTPKAPPDEDRRA